MHVPIPVVSVSLSLLIPPVIIKVEGTWFGRIVKLQQMVHERKVKVKRDDAKGILLLVLVVNIETWVKSRSVRRGQTLRQRYSFGSALAIGGFACTATR
jgi:hypothetical protein